MLTYMLIKVCIAVGSTFQSASFTSSLTLTLLMKCSGVLADPTSALDLTLRKHKLNLVNQLIFVSNIMFLLLAFVKIISFVVANCLGFL